jgi:hypothetical protein
MAFLALVALAATLASAIAALAGFGIGSILTPLVAAQTGMKTAVAAVAIPHFVATLLRFWRLRAHVDWRVLRSFGLVNAAGGLAGALLHSAVQSSVLSSVLATLLIFAGLVGVLGYAERMRFGRRAAWIAGAVSGAFGGLVGNQGGIRAAAMLGLSVEREAFVATATGIGVLVDLARMPVYLLNETPLIVQAWRIVVAALVGVIAGTLGGERVLRRIPRSLFRRVVSALLLAIGLLLLGGRK